MGFTFEFLHIILLLLLLLLLLLSSSCINLTHAVSSRRSSNGTEEVDRVALLAFKACITNDPLRVVSSWNDSIPYCQWPGVICGNCRHPNRVQALHLDSKGLVGSMASEIGNLSFLREISIENNSFHDEIPREVSFVFRLRYLSLLNNSFEGEIPPNISRCSNLIRLNLGGNNIVGGIPKELGTLSKLQFLALYKNRLTGKIPPSIGNLSSLEILSIAYNDVSGIIPNALGRMTRLTLLAFGENKLSGTIPLALYNLSSLTILDVGGNQLEGSLPPNLGFGVPNIQKFSVAENHFHGPIPISLSNLSKLSDFEVTNNSFTGKVNLHFGALSKLIVLYMALNHLGSGEADDMSFISTLTNCSSLTHVELGGNRFGGVLPNSIANMSAQLRELALEENQMFGNVPEGIGNLVSLQYLALPRNFLGGSILTSIGRLQMLHYLDLGGNRFTGSIPSSLGNLTQLISLYLNDNHFHGKIPSRLGKCKSLLRLYLSNNSFNGIIPKEIFYLPMIIELNLSKNYFFGSLPYEVGQLTNLEIIEVSQNRLSGEIPSTLGACTSLEHIFMEGNLFQGSIPSSLSSLRALQDLDLSHNNFSGFIPKFLETFKFLQNLNLSFNQLEGEVPSKGVFGNLSAVSVLGNIKLCGIPDLHLLACQTQNSKDDGWSHVFKLVVTICGCGASLCAVFMSYVCITYRRRKEKKESMPLFIGDFHFKISYGQLLKATDEFSSANLIGVGSFGSVYKGILGYGETIVAIKVLNIEQKGASKSFMAECEALRNVRHRNLVKILTTCSSIDFQGNDFKALIYEFMPSENLEKWLHPYATGIHDEQRHLNLIQRLNIALDIAIALDYLHHHCHMQIIHCDLKPSNILLDDDLTAHLGDFGISRILSEATDNSQSQTTSIGIKGSIGYIPLEYGAGAGVSTHGDVYSYGILLLEIFTKKRPTDVMFEDNFTLHYWAKRSLQDGVVTVIDPSLLPMEEDDVEEVISNINGSQTCMNDRVQECLNLIIGIGVACSAELSWDRMDMNDVIKELHLIRDIYLGVRTN